MNPILRQSLTAGLTALRRYGWFPLAVFLTHGYCSHVLNAYERWPAIDIPLHFLGGLSITYFAAGVLRVWTERRFIRRPDPILRWILLLALAFTAAVLWEFAEWTSDRFLGTHCQMNDLGDTLLDLLMGVLGALAFLLPQLPSALRAYFNPEPE